MVSTGRKRACLVEKIRPSGVAGSRQDQRGGRGRFGCGFARVDIQQGIEERAPAAAPLLYEQFKMLQEDQQPKGRGLAGLVDAQPLGFGLAELRDRLLQRPRRSRQPTDWPEGSRTAGRFAKCDACESTPPALRGCRIHHAGVLRSAAGQGMGHENQEFLVLPRNFFETGTSRLGRVSGSRGAAFRACGPPGGTRNPADNRR